MFEWGIYLHCRKQLQVKPHATLEELHQALSEIFK
jgi:hypothetical protein